MKDKIKERKRLHSHLKYQFYNLAREKGTEYSLQDIYWHFIVYSMKEARNLENGKK